MATTTSSDPKPAPLETPLLSDVHLSLGEASLSQPPAKSIEVYEPSIAAASGYTNHGLEGELSKKVHFVSLVDEFFPAAHEVQLDAPMALTAPALHGSQLVCPVAA